MLGLLKKSAVAPVSTILPCCITATRSAIVDTSAKSWLIKPQMPCRSAAEYFSAMPVFEPVCYIQRCGRFIAISKSGLPAKAIAIITRCADRRKADADSL